jgi:hypothetical protein
VDENTTFSLNNQANIIIKIKKPATTEGGRLDFSLFVYYYKPALPLNGNNNTTGNHDRNQ